MNISEIITLVSQLFTNNQNSQTQSKPIQQTDYNQYWQLPNYDTNTMPKNNIINETNNIQSQDNTQQTNNVDIQSIIKLITTILELLPKNKVEEPKQKEIYPSYISNLPRTDQFNNHK